MTDEQNRTAEDKAVTIVARWMKKRGYSTGGADNIGFLLSNLESQIWARVSCIKRSNQ